MPSSTAQPPAILPPGSRAALYVLIGSLGIQLSSALSATMFDSLGSPAVSSLRLLIAAAVLLAVLRPSFTGKSAGQWATIIGYGIVMAVMNLLLYQAIEYLPLGIAVTLDFLGPAMVALFLARKPRQALWAALALAGVLLIAGPAGHFHAVGFAFGLGAGLCFALYTILAEKVGKQQQDSISSLALSVTVAAVVSLPFGAPRILEVSAPQWAMLALSGVIGVAVPYAVDTLAARLTSARVIGTLFAIDPAMGTLMGWAVLGQSLGAWALLGIVLVAVAGACVAWLDSAPPAASETHTASDDHCSEPSITP